VLSVCYTLRLFFLAVFLYLALAANYAAGSPLSLESLLSSLHLTLRFLTGVRELGKFNIKACICSVVKWKVVSLLPDLLRLAAGFVSLVPEVLLSLNQQSAKL
jgi:hypothetical protein